MTEMKNSKRDATWFGRFRSRAAQALAPRVDYCNLEFVCYLVLGIWNLLIVDFALL